MSQSSEEFTGIAGIDRHEGETLTAYKKRFLALQKMPTYFSASALGSYAGVSDQVVRSRVADGTLIPAAMLNNGSYLYTLDQAVALIRR